MKEKSFKYFHYLKKLLSFAKKTEHKIIYYSTRNFTDYTIQSQKFNRGNPILTYFITPIVMIFAILLLREFLGKYFIQAPFLLFVLGVAFSSWNGGFRAGVFSTIMSAVVIKLFVFPGDRLYENNTSGQLLSSAVFLVIGFLMSVLSESLHRAISLEQKKVRLAEEQKETLLLDKEFISHILKSIEEGFVVLDKDLTYIYVNSKAEQMMNKSQEELIGYKINEIFPHPTSGTITFIDTAKKVMQTKKSQHTEYFSSVANTWVSVDMFPYMNGVSAYFKDISASKITEEKLLLTLKKFQTIFNSELIGVAIENDKGEILDANNTFLNMVQYPETTLKNKLTVKDITDPKYLKQDEEIIKALFDKKKISPIEKEYIRPDGTHISVIKMISILDEQEKTVVVFVLDITERKNLEKRKDEFLSIVAHELKTPLTSIKVFVQLLEKYLKDQKDKKALSFLDPLESQFYRLIDLTEDLLDIRKIEEGKLDIEKKAFDLDPLVDSVIKEVQVISNRHTIKKEKQQELWISADRYRISQVLINLITNAIKYSEDNGSIVINLEKKDHQAVVSVKDFGIGIPEEKLEGIFKKFYRINDSNRISYPGMGLGLYISAEIIKRHQGKIWLQSKEGEGSTFYFSLPLITKPKELQ